jgi:hypothetical protein
LIRMFNYAPCPHIIILSLFSPEQNLISRNPNMFRIMLYNILASAFLSGPKTSYYRYRAR